jgi:hypothetical protein
VRLFVTNNVCAVSPCPLPPPPPTSVESGTSFTLAVAALDGENARDLFYTGTVAFSSSDSAATLPANQTFVSTDEGGKLFTVVLITLGRQTITATDTSGTVLPGTFSIDVTPPGTLCSISVSRLCLAAGRFRAEVTWGARDSPRLGQAVFITPNTGAFWFFDPTNLELVVKVLDGRSINGRFWVFYGSLTNVEFTLTVTDTQTGAVKAYANPQGQLASVADTLAF